ncbi:MAG: alkaline shock response membrane anchor protein AmaP [Hyphomicrobiales bacterium]
MNGLRRALLAFYSVLFLAACAGLIALAWNQDQQLDIHPEGFRFVSYITSGDSEKWLFTALMACLGLFALLTLVVALTRSTESSGGRLRLRQAEGGTIEITAGAVESLIRDDLERVPEIRRADPRVRLGSNGAVETAVTAVIEPSASIAHVTNLIGVTIASTLREQLGVTNVRRPSVRIEYDEVAARPVAVEQRQRPQRATRQIVRHQEPWPPPPEGLYDRPPAPGRHEEPWPEPAADLRQTYGEPEPSLQAPAQPDGGQPSAEQPSNEQPAAEQQPEGARQASD